MLELSWVDGKKPTRTGSGLKYEKCKSSAKVFAGLDSVKHHTPVPVSCETENVYRSFGTPLSKTCGVLIRNGIYYASLRIRGEEVPLEIALHGIQSESEACRALESLIALRGSECWEARP